MKRAVVDNSEIKAFYDKCQEIVSYWNANRPDRGGEINVTLELVSRKTDELVIRIDPELGGFGKVARLTILQIWFDPATSTFMGKTPGLPTDNTQKVTLDDLERTLNKFNP